MSKAFTYFLLRSCFRAYGATSPPPSCTHPLPSPSLPFLDRQHELRQRPAGAFGRGTAQRQAGGKPGAPGAPGAGDQQQGGAPPAVGSKREREGSAEPGSGGGDDADADGAGANKRQHTTAGGSDGGEDGAGGHAQAQESEGAGGDGGDWGDHGDDKAWGDGEGDGEAEAYNGGADGGEGDGEGHQGAAGGLDSYGSVGAEEAAAGAKVKQEEAAGGAAAGAVSRARGVRRGEGPAAAWDNNTSQHKCPNKEPMHSCILNLNCAQIAKS